MQICPILSGCLINSCVLKIGQIFLTADDLGVDFEHHMHESSWLVINGCG